MGCFQLNENWASLERNLDIPQNSFKSKAVGFWKLSADVVVFKFSKTFLMQEIEWRQTFDWMNSIKPKS